MFTWTELLRSNFTNWKELADFLDLNVEQRRKIIECKPFPLNLPRRLAEKIEKGTLEDPILKQFLPVDAENEDSPEFSTDPLEENSACTTPRMLQKFSKRALFVTTSVCAMHCRFCFRRHFDYAKGAATFEEELAAVRGDPSLEEIILSGGDPLSLSNRRLRDLIESLNAISHLRRIRIHSRFPIGIPERIDDGLLAVLEGGRPQVWFVLHCNHPRELDNDVVNALSRLQRLGIPLLNHTVLLRGVNDDVQTLVSLSERLIDSGVMPYYLFQLDRVQGAAHFEVSPDLGLKLVEELRARLPGYGVPQYVREVPGQRNKIPVSTSG